MRTLLILLAAALAAGCTGDPIRDQMIINRLNAAANVVNAAAATAYVYQPPVYYYTPAPRMVTTNCSRVGPMVTCNSF
jgi:hypothetical protein